MIFNFTDKYKFTANLKLNDEKLEVVNQAKLLGVIISDDLKWDKNTEYLVKKAYSRMELLRKVAEFTKSIDDKREIYILYIRSILEQSCVVWHSSLTEENALDLERVQKAAIRLILGEKNETYEDGLLRANLESLKERREKLCKTFAMKCVNSENPRVNNIFSKKKTEHGMDLRKNEKYEVKFAKTNRLKNSSVPYMQRILNTDNLQFEKQDLKRKKRYYGDKNIEKRRKVY